MKITNKRARFDYKIEDEFEAGIVLTGEEVKALKQGRVNITQAHARIVDDEAYIVNLNLNEVENPSRSRKLLLHKDQILAIKAKIRAKRLTLVPISVYTKSRLVKVKLGLGRTKRKFEKRETIKKRDIEREIRKSFKN